MDSLGCCSIISLATNSNQQHYASNPNIGWIGTLMIWPHYYQLRNGSAM